MLNLSGLRKSFDSIAAVKAFSLTVPVGRTTVLIGPRGVLSK